MYAYIYMCVYDDAFLARSSEDEERGQQGICREGFRARRAAVPVGKHLPGSHAVDHCARPGASSPHHPEREFFIDNLLVQIHFIIEMIG